MLAELTRIYLPIIYTLHIHIAAGSHFSLAALQNVVPISHRAMEDSISWLLFTLPVPAIHSASIIYYFIYFFKRGFVWMQIDIANSVCSVHSARMLTVDQCRLHLCILVALLCQFFSFIYFIILRMETQTIFSLGAFWRILHAACWNVYPIWISTACKLN